VLGAGGAARAVVYVLHAGGASVSVANRTRSKAEALTRDVVDWEALAEALGGYDILVNATSVGLDGRATPVEPHALAGAAAGRLKAVIDVVYGKGGTPLTRAASEAGLVASDGLPMLVYQAAEAFRLFFGAEAPTETMFEAVTQTD
jgi:shikimate dehydrogenase